jgi:hypothetical protein
MELSLASFVRLAPWCVAAVCVISLVLAVRIWAVIVPARVKSVSGSAYAARSRGGGATVRVMAVLGSGGHTTELLKLMKRLKRDVYTPITFVVAETDKTSADKTRLDWKPSAADSFVVIPRSREVRLFIASIAAGASLDA